MSRKRPLSEEGIRSMLVGDVDADSDSDSDGLSELYDDADRNVSSDDSDEALPEQVPETSTGAATALSEPSASAETRRGQANRIKDIDSALDADNYDAFQSPREDKFVVQVAKKTRDEPEKKITWTTEVPLPPGRQNRANIIRIKPGVRGRKAKNASDALQAWSLFFDEEMIEMIVRGTNKRLQKRKETLSEKERNDSRNSDTDSTEIKAFIGLAYARGLLGQNHHDIQRVFHPKTGHQIFSACMSLRRFRRLNSDLSMDDPDDRQKRWEADRFAACRALFERFKSNCLQHVVAEEMVALDETLYPTRNTVKFRQYNRNKPAKYGLLFRSVNATTFPYTYVSTVYAGRPVGEPGPYYVTGLEDTVKELLKMMMDHNSLQGRNVTMDRLYTSVPLAEWMLDRDVTVVGTLNINRRGIPPELKTITGREDNSYMALFEDSNKKMSLHSYAVTTKSTGRRNVLLLTTMNPIMGVTKDAKKKPAIFRLYDVTKGGTDVVDQRMGSYTTKPKSRKWTVAALCYVLDTCRVNAASVLALNTGKHPRDVVSVEFGWDLVLQLVEPHMQRRKSENLPKSVQAKIGLMLQPDELGPSTSGGSQTEDVAQESGIRRRCSTCLRNLPTVGHKAAKGKLQKVLTVCSRCGKPLCITHAKLSCDEF